MPSYLWLVTRLTNALTWAARWAGSLSSDAMAEALSDSVTGGSTVIPALCSASTTSPLPTPADFAGIVVALLASYPNGGASPHGSALLVIDFIESAVDQ